MLESKTIKKKLKLVMSQSQPTERELLQQILKPLLEDFDYWFARARQLLENESIPFMTANEQADLLDRLKHSQQELLAAKALFAATDGQVGIESTTMLAWHKLLSECWYVAVRYRQQQSPTMQ
jgi:hypothetical protein